MGAEALSAMATASGIPKDMNSFMLTFIQREDSVVVLIGHPTRELIDQALTLPGLPKALAIIQQEMHDAPKSYDLWPVDGGTRSFDIATPLVDALREAGAAAPK